jgi:hypothetical protein
MRADARRHRASWARDGAMPAPERDWVKGKPPVTTPPWRRE